MKKFFVGVIAVAMLLSSIVVYAHNIEGGSEIFTNDVFAARNIDIAPLQSGSSVGTTYIAWWQRGTSFTVGIPLTLHVWSYVTGDVGASGLGSVIGADGTTHNGGWQRPHETSFGRNASRGGDFTRVSNWNTRRG